MSTTNSTTKSITIPKATRRTSRRQVEELARRFRKMPKYKTKLYLEKEARRQEALAQGKKPQGRKRKIKAINTQMTQGDI
jgi:hypothetical protein